MSQARLIKRGSQRASDVLVGTLVLVQILTKDPFYNYTLVHTLSQTNLECWTCRGKKKIGTYFTSRVNRCFIISKGEGGIAADNLVWQLWGPGDAWLADGDIAPVSGQIRCHQIDGYGLLAGCVAGGYRCRVSLACARGMCVCVESEARWRRGEGGGGSVQRREHLKGFTSVAHAGNPGAEHGDAYFHFRANVLGPGIV